MFNVEIYVDGTRLDLFDDENIQITDTIQDAKDPGKIFTAFSQTFTVPASKTNNKVFKHYYNNRINVLDTGTGFDARFDRPETIIKINGVDYKKGVVRLNSVKLKNGKAYSYEINFIGDGSDLINAIKDDDLSALSGPDLLDKFNHDYSLANFKTGVTHGLGLSGGSMVQANGTTIPRSIIYPLISHTKRYVYDSSFTGAGTFKMYNPAVTAGSEGLDYQQFKPAIRCLDIIEAIETKYGITFTRDFFGTAAFTDLYMWLNRTKGFIEGITDNTTYFYSDLNSMTYSGSTVDVTKKDAQGHYTTAFDQGFVSQDYEYTYTVTPTGSGNYEFVLFDQNNQVLLEERVNTGTKNFVYTHDTKFNTDIRPTVRIISEGTITDIDISLSLVRNRTVGSGVTSETGVYDWVNVAPNNFATISVLIPKMKVIDFLKGVFKMFNLTHYKKANGDIYVDTLDNFYALGGQLDITNQVDVSESTTITPITFDTISFEYTEPKTFLNKNRFELLNRRFGNSTYDIGSVFSGAEYKIETGFSHMVFEHLEDLSDGSDSLVLFGWAVDEDEGATTDAPLMLYFRGTQTMPGKALDFSDEVETTFYVSLGNTDAVTAVGDSIHFGSEIDEFTKTENQRSLYANYYQNYISEVYGGYSRTVRYTAYLTPSFILNYNLYDKVVISGILHKINSITISLLDGKAELELITQP